MSSPAPSVSWGFQRRFRESAFLVSICDYESFFSRLAETARDSLGARMALVWDNSDQAQALILLAGCEHITPTPLTDTLVRRGSLTEKAIDTRKITVNRDIRNTIGAMRRITFGNISEMDLTHMVSVPAIDAAGERVPFILNLFFDSTSDPELLPHAVEMQWLQTSLGLALDYLSLRVNDKIRCSVDRIVASAADLSGLFAAVWPLLSSEIGADAGAFYSVESDSRTLRLEAHEGFETSVLACERGRRGLYSVVAADCLKDGSARLSATVLQDDRRADSEKVFWPLLAIPLKTAAGQLVGVLLCRKARRSQTHLSFTSLDLRSANAFCLALVPYIERFIRLRSTSILVDAVKLVSRVWSEPGDINLMLQQTIETIVDTLNADVGSIFLREDEGPAVGRFVLRAATGPMKKLAGIAMYQPGEGLTGTIAQGKLLRFRSWEERRDAPKRLAKYEEEIWAGSAHEPDGAYLGVPIERRDEVIGLWKIENIRPSPRHPDDYFTDEDVDLARVLSAFLAYAIDDRRYQDAVSRDLKLLAQSTMGIANASREEDAIEKIMGALAACSVPGAMLSLYDDKARTIVGHSASGDKWPLIKSESISSLDSGDLLSQALSRDQAYFVPDSSRDTRCNQKLVRKASLGAQYVIPLRSSDEMIGTLQVDMQERVSLDPDMQRLLDAFASHLTISISRIRAMDRAMDMTNRVISSSRFIVAEALAGLAIHSVSHTLRDISDMLGDVSERREVRERREVLSSISNCRQRVNESFEKVRDALALVRTERSNTPRVTDAHEGIQDAINGWIALLQNERCSIRKHLEAPRSRCRIAPHEFREILSVLIVNSVQAHARNIDIRTACIERFRTPPGGFLVSALLLEFKDDGQGLTSHQPEEVFSPHYTTKPDKLGTGLGLFIARELARHSGGDIWAEPEVEKGATFMLALPLSRSD